MEDIPEYLKAILPQEQLPEPGIVYYITDIGQRYAQNEKDFVVGLFPRLWLCVCWRTQRGNTTVFISKPVPFSTSILPVS